MGRKSTGPFIIEQEVSGKQGTSTRKYWPSPQDYSEAVQTPRVSFADSELCMGVAETNRLGLPRCMSGNFASVFCFRCETRKVAVRCFLHNVPDQQSRYSAISKFVLADDLPYTVPFEYIVEGVKIRDVWYPLLKMEWVDGVTLNQFVSGNVKIAVALNLLASYFKQMVLELRRAGIAHGDLQHDNILISQDELRLVDYDGMFVPSLLEQGATELGHSNYQHPARNKENFGSYLDNFSAWVIYSSLKMLSLDASLWDKLQGGSDCLLLRKADFVSPERSAAFKTLQRHENLQIRGYSYHLRHLLEMTPDLIPAIDAPLRTTPIAPPTSNPHTPDWLRQWTPTENATGGASAVSESASRLVRAVNGAANTSASDIAPRLPLSPAVSTKVQRMLAADEVIVWAMRPVQANEWKPRYEATFFCLLFLGCMLVVKFGIGCLFALVMLVVVVCIVGSLLAAVGSGRVRGAVVTNYRLITISDDDSLEARALNTVRHVSPSPSSARPNYVVICGYDSQPDIKVTGLKESDVTSLLKALPPEIPIGPLAS